MLNDNKKTPFGMLSQHPHEVVINGRVLFVGDRYRANKLAAKFNLVARVKLRVVT